MTAGRLQADEDVVNDEANGIRVRAATAADKAAWRRLWNGYLKALGAEVPEDVTEHCWSRLLDPSSGLFARLAERDGEVVGFAVCVLHPGTWKLQPICYLEDLGVDEAVRGQGVGRALIEDLLALARSRGWSRLYWHTNSANHQARRLYDKFAPADDVVRYQIELDRNSQL